MMNKTRITALILCLLLLAATSCAKAPTAASEAAEATEAPEAPSKPYSAYNEMLEQMDMTKLISGEGMTADGFEKGSLQEVEAASEIIVLATVKHKEQVDNTPEELIGTGVVVETTVTTLQIEQAFKGKELLDESGELVIEEICYVVEYNDGTSALATAGMYYPAKEYETYLFFLKELEGGKAKYTPTSRWYGKYPAEVAATVSEEESVLTYRDLELASKNMENEAPENMRNLYAEVCDKYFSGKDVVIAKTPVSEYNKLLEKPIWPDRQHTAERFYTVIDGKLHKEENDLIVLATVVSKTQYAGITTELYKNTDYTTDQMLKGTTLATLKILKVFKGAELLDGADELEIQELCYVWENDSDGEIWISAVDDYYPTKEYTTYLFFLRELENGTAKYMPDGPTGKFPITKAAKTVYDRYGLCEGESQQGGYDSFSQTGCAVDIDGLLLEQQCGFGTYDVRGTWLIENILCKKYFKGPAVIAAFEAATH